MSGVHSRALRRAAELIGGAQALCDYLQVPAADMRRWLEGLEAPPAGIFLRAVDVIIEPGVSSPVREPSGPTSGDDRRGPA